MNEIGVLIKRLECPITVVKYNCVVELNEFTPAWSEGGDVLFIYSKSGIDLYKPLSLAFYQSTMAELIDLNLIACNKLKAFIVKNELEKNSSFSAVRSFNKNELETSAFKLHEASFNIAAPVNEVWNFYKNIHPVQCWDIGIIKMGAYFNQPEKKFVYPHTAFNGIDVGHKVLVKIVLLGGAINSITGHEIININEQEKFFETAYLTFSKTKGFQKVQFSDAGNNTTLITHVTRYLADSALRNMLYPYFHNKVITKFHENIKEQILQKTEN